MERTEVITAYGHELIQSTHKTTFEITKDRLLTRRGDCIIAVNSDKAAVDLSQPFKEAARKPGSEITITIEAGGEKETVRAFGNPHLSFTHPADIVIRKSRYVCGRTVAVRADKAAGDLSRKLVEKLRNRNQIVKVTLTVKNRG
jgi:hypothetical protein